MRALARLPLFAGLPAEAIEKLTEPMARKVFSRNELIIEQGAPGKAAFLLIDGKVEVFSTSKAGERITIIFHEAPYIFGEFEVWDRRPYLASVRALERTELLIVSQKEFLALLQSHHQVAVNLSRLVCHLLYETGQDRRIKFFGRVEHLLANTFCSFARMYGREHEYGIRIDREISNTELAEILGVARKSVIQAVNKLQKSGVIQKEGKYVMIPDLAALRDLAHSS